MLYIVALCIVAVTKPGNVQSSWRISGFFLSRNIAAFSTQFSKKLVCLNLSFLSFISSWLQVYLVMLGNIFVNARSTHKKLQNGTCTFIIKLKLIDWLINWLINFMLLYSTLENSSFIRRLYYCRWKTAKRSLLFPYGL